MLNKPLDVMIDLETLSTRSNAAILSVGAVAWCPTSGELGKTFYQVVDTSSAIDSGLHIDENTVKWWQEPEQKSAFETILTSEKVHMLAMLNDFTEYLCSIENPNRLRIWSNGATFDIPILENAYYSADLQAPWKFWNCRDMRTLVGFYPPPLFTNLKHGHPRKGHHNSLEDAIWQANICSNILQDLGVERLY